jgi:hypothetical protein
MDFKEYLEFSKLQEDIDFINEGIGSTLMGVIDAGISGTGTAGKQILRGAGNTVRGIGGLATHSLGSVFGDEKSREDARKKLGPSLNRTFRGVSQLATSPYAALRRGWEAGRDPFSELKPDDGSGWGEMMGIRRKDQPQESQPQPKENPKSEQIPSFEELLDAAYRTKNKQEQKEIYSKMKKFHREKYEEFKIKVKRDRIQMAKKILGFEKGEIVTRRSLKRKRDELAKKHHPDQGGDAKVFSKIQQAYEFLIDEISQREQARKAM